MSERPDYVFCIEDTTTRDSECGRRAPPEFMFLSKAHAGEHVRLGGRLLICPGCAEKVKLTEGVWQPK